MKREKKNLIKEGNWLMTIQEKKLFIQRVIQKKMYECQKREYLIKNRHIAFEEDQKNYNQNQLKKEKQQEKYEKNLENQEMDSNITIYNLIMIQEYKIRIKIEIEKNVLMELKNVMNLNKKINQIMNLMKMNQIMLVALIVNEEEISKRGNFDILQILRRFLIKYYFFSHLIGDGDLYSEFEISGHVDNDTFSVVGQLREEFQSASESYEVEYYGERVVDEDKEGEVE
ncbi:MAG: hypothetical protein EZS28_012174 [Streblomastix strix]|uniref:Uncharacterized protein n=1 Tax=Streblomastix strix TaxID=222440 RepID=A0A5J4WBM3_9EUKA|nr:MAG: hypothetical protein EZS28_012174 [Streblomastix strix]